MRAFHQMTASGTGEGFSKNSGVKHGNDTKPVRYLSSLLTIDRSRDCTRYATHCGAGGARPGMVACASTSPAVGLLHDFFEIRRQG